MKTTIKVALADDHNLFRKGVEEILADFDNVEVLYSVHNGRELITQITNKGILPDVCLLDINMPELNGFETAAQIKVKWPGINILAVSVYDSEHTILSMLRAGAGGYVLKDTQPAMLRLAIESLHQHGFYCSELVNGRLLHQALTQGSAEPGVALTANETRFLKLCCSELTYKEIAEMMELSHRTIDGYRDNLFDKLNLKSRTGLVIYALKKGIATIDEYS